MRVQRSRTAIAISGLSNVRVVQGPRAAAETLAAGSHGLLLRIGQEEGGALRFDILLAYGDDAQDVLLFADVDEAQVVALWRRTAADLGQPLLIETPAGETLEATPQIGLVLRGPTHERRRILALTKRRPLFLRRRKTARLPDRPVMVHGVEMPFRR
ncbi:MAG: hypothetical protein U1E62_04780 [Alsobacter sp.]